MNKVDLIYGWAYYNYRAKKEFNGEMYQIFNQLKNPFLIKSKARTALVREPYCKLCRPFAEARDKILRNKNSSKIECEKAIKEFIKNCPSLKDEDEEKIKTEYSVYTEHVRVVFETVQKLQKEQTKEVNDNDEKRRN